MTGGDARKNGEDTGSKRTLKGREAGTRSGRRGGVTTESLQVFGAMCQLSMLGTPRNLTPGQSLPRPLTSSAEREKKRRRLWDEWVKQIFQGGPTANPKEWRARTLATLPCTPAASSGSSDGQEGGRATDREREWLQERGREWEGEEEDAEDEYADEDEDNEVAEDGMGREARPFRAMAVDSFHRVPALSSVTDRTDSVAANGRPAPQPHASCPSILDICAAPSGRAWLQQAPRGSTAAPLARAMADASPIAPRSLLDRERSDTCPGLSSHPAPEASWKSPQRSMSDSLSGIPGAWRAALLPEVVAARKCLSLPLGAIAPRGHVAEAGAATSPALVSWHAGAGPHACSICGMRFPTVQALGGHRNGHRELKGVHPQKGGAGKRRARRKAGRSGEGEEESRREREREREGGGGEKERGRERERERRVREETKLAAVAIGASAGSGTALCQLAVTATETAASSMDMRHLGGHLDGLSVPFLAMQREEDGADEGDRSLLLSIEPCCGQYCNFFSMSCRSVMVLGDGYGNPHSRTPFAYPTPLAGVSLVSPPSSLLTTQNDSSVNFTFVPLPWCSARSLAAAPSLNGTAVPCECLVEAVEPDLITGKGFLSPGASGEGGFSKKKAGLPEEILRRIAAYQRMAGVGLAANQNLTGDLLAGYVDLDLKLAW